MAEISFDPIDTQELFTTGSLNNRFSAGANSLQTPINDLDPDALAPGALNEAHLPSLTLYRAGIGQSAGAIYTFGNTPFPGTWATIDHNGESGGGTPLEQNLGGTTYNLSSGQAEGVFVMADLYVGYIRQGGTTYAATDGVGFKIQAYNGTSWQTISRTHRFLAAAIYSGAAASGDGGSGRWIDVKVPIRTLIKAADVTNNTISSVRVQISVVSPSATASTSVFLKACYLSVVVLQSTVT